MNNFLSAAQADQLQKIARRYKERGKVGKPWHQRTDDELWRQVLSEIVAIGRAEPGERIQHDPKIKGQVSIKKLQNVGSDAQLRKYLHDLFRRLGVRRVGKNLNKDQKAAAAAKNFCKLTEKDTPRKFFDRVAECKTEAKKIEMVKDLEFFGNKTSRDTLIELGLAKNCMALDARIYGLLAKVGVKVSPDEIYKQIEKELIQKVATPLGMSGALLDRALFQNYDQILKQG